MVAAETWFLFDPLGTTAFSNSISDWLIIQYCHLSNQLNQLFHKFQSKTFLGMLFY